MKMYQKRNLIDEEKICNYQFSRARRVSENAFGILVSRFQVLKEPIALKNLNTVDDVVLVCCTLHNWLMKMNPTYFTPNNVNPAPADIAWKFTEYLRSQYPTISIDIFTKST
jgi:hypothetical protein